MTYGVLPTGFARKPLSVILAEIEADLVTEFGPGLIQTPQSPMGQINGVFSEKAYEFNELAEDVYQSLDPDQAEGARLDILGRIRRISRARSEDDVTFRAAITNRGRARIDIQDIKRAIAGIPGVTYVEVWVNDSGETDANNMPTSSVCVAVTGGDGDAIAAAIRQYIVPGVTLFGSTVVESVIDGYCRSFRVLRPIDVPVELQVFVKTRRDRLGCPPPSTQAVKQAILDNISFVNGEDITYFKIRSIVESLFPNVEVTYIMGARFDQSSTYPNSAVDIAFIERASLAPDDLSVEIDPA